MRTFIRRSIKLLIKLVIYKPFIFIQERAEDYKNEILLKKHNIHHSSDIKATLIGNIYIGKNTYINNGSTISTGQTSHVRIGDHCAIGRYVHITSKSHSFRLPTSDKNFSSHEHFEKNTIIGNCVWIGDHVFIKHGVSIADYAIIGANSVVNRDVESFEIVGGVPIKHIRFNTEHYKFSK